MAKRGKSGVVKQEKVSSTTYQGKPVASIPSRASATRVAAQKVDTKPSTKMPVPKTTAKAEQQAEEKVQKRFRRMRRRQFLIGGLGVAATVVGLGSWLLAESPHSPFPIHSTQENDNGDQLILRWNNIILQTIRTLQPSMPVAARALAIVHTCMFDAWAAYDPVAVGTQFGAQLKRAETDQTGADQAQALCYAAYHALVDLFPSEKQRFQQMMTSLKYDPADQGLDASTPAGVGNLTAQAVLDFRHADRSNQLGTIIPGAYADYTHYNTPDVISDPNHWQPLRVPDAQHPASFVQQRFYNAQWGDVMPFALASAAALLPVPGPPLSPSPAYTEQAQQILQYSANLNDEQKVLAEYWMHGPSKEQPPGHWNLLAQMIAQRLGYTLDQNIKLFFTLTNALLDASIACWAAKRAYSSPYPLTAIHYLFRGKQVRAWAGPGLGTQMINGANWQPYQPSTLVMPSYPEYCSEQSVFSAAAADILQ
ncbi:MAG: vanadium-dependent haloperoxidase, partial [Ktedonobacteraceae bacterium]